MRTIPASLIGILPILCVLPIMVQAQERAGEVLQQLERRELRTGEQQQAPAVIDRKEAPAAEDIGGFRMRVTSFSVVDATLIDAGVIESITEPYEGRDLTLAEISGVADLITNAYRRAGYILAYAYLPAQDIENGIVTIRVLEGAIAKIFVSGNTHYSDAFIRKYLARTKEEPSLKLGALERQLLILNDFPSLTVKTTLRAGERPGTSDIIARASDSRHIHGGLSYDNFGSKTISKHRLSPWLELGSLAREGDLLSLRATTGLDRIDMDRLSYGRAAYSLPVARNGTRLGGYYSYSVYEVGDTLAPLDITGSAHVAGVFLSYPVLKRTHETLALQVGVEYKDVDDRMLGALRSRDKIRSVNLGLQYDSTDSGGARNMLSLTYNRGIPGVLGGSENGDLGTSRMDAKADFQRLTVDFVRSQKIPGGFHLVFKGMGQASSDVLFSAEQFAVGGYGTVRGFKPSRHTGDSGYLLNIEAYSPPLMPNLQVLNRQNHGEALRGLVFFDHGNIHRNQVQPGESPNDRLTSAGAGLRLYLDERFSLQFDWAVPWIDDGFETGKSVAYVQTVLEF